MKMVPIASLALALVLTGTGAGCEADDTVAAPPAPAVESDAGTADAPVLPAIDPSLFTISGTVAGTQGGSVILANGGDLIAVAGDGRFTFGGGVADATAYRVTVRRNPPGRDCAVDHGSGTIASASVVDVAVTCRVAAIEPPSP